jgi:hypothetical protein
MLRRLRIEKLVKIIEIARRLQPQQLLDVTQQLLTLERRYSRLSAKKCRTWAQPRKGKGHEQYEQARIRVDGP